VIDKTEVKKKKSPEPCKGTEEESKGTRKVRRKKRKKKVKRPNLVTMQGVAVAYDVKKRAFEKSWAARKTNLTG